MSASATPQLPTREVHPTIVLDRVRTGYGTTERLHDISLRLGAGIHLLVGANGSGKTTLFRAIAGILPLWSGSVSIDRRLGYVAHRPALSPRLTVADDLEFWGRVLGLSPRERRERSDEVARQLDIGPLLGRPIADLSRGQSQRVAIAKALLSDPSVLLLDEPLGGVDPLTAQRVRDDLRRRADHGCTILISSHELAELSGMGADVVALASGRIVAHGSTDELLIDAGAQWMRLRAGRGAPEHLTALGVAHRATGEGLEVHVGGRDEMARVVKSLVDAGIDVYELTPVRSDLTQIFLRLQEDDRAEHR